MEIVAIVKSLEHVCCRYRLAAFRPFLAAAGHRLVLLPWSASFLGGCLLPRKLRQADVVILQRLLLPGWQLSLLRKQVRHLIFDFDDAVYLHDSYDVRGPASLHHVRRFRHTVQAADVVVAGNDFLADQARQWTEPARVRVIPTCVDVDRYPRAAHQRQGGAELVWIGSSSTRRGLERIRPLLDRLGRQFPALSLKILCDEPLRLNDLPTRFCPWSTAAEATDLAAADVGISWLPDDEWSRGKCGLKILQYMAAGLPVLANPVGVQADLIEPGVTGFLPRTAQGWFDAVQALVGSAALRRSLGERGRQRVQSQFGVDTGAREWLAALAGAGRTGKPDLQGVA